MKRDEKKGNGGKGKRKERIKINAKARKNHICKIKEKDESIKRGKGMIVI